MADVSEKPQTKPREAWHEEAGNIIVAGSEQLAHSIMQMHLERNPDLAAAYGEHERNIYIRDTIYSLEALAASIKLLTPEMFAEYVLWLDGMLKARNIPTAGLPLHFKCMKEALEGVLSKEMWHHAVEYVNMGMQELS